jgi:hypothetical protein
MHFRTAWSDYFTTTNTTNLNSQIYDSRQTPSYTNLYISNCLFKSISSTSDGGALCCTSVTYLLVESTSFFYCSTNTQNGGAIFFSTSNGQCVLYEVCGYYCCSTYTSYSYGQFVCTSVNNGIKSKNYVNYSSISRCMNQISTSHHVLCLSYGKICCPSINVSMNKCPYSSGIYCYPYIDSSSVTSSITYSSFADNFATTSICFYLWNTGPNHEIQSCNILRNTQGSVNSHGMFYTIGNVMIKDSCILENNANCIFCQVNSNYKFTLSNCTTDSTSNNGYITITNTVTKSFILALNHMSNLICNSEYDSAGTLTPIIQPPSPSKKPKLCYTFGNFFCPSQLRTFISLLSVFLFNFIHLNSSN